MRVLLGVPQYCSSFYVCSQIFHSLGHLSIYSVFICLPFSSKRFCKCHPKKPLSALLLPLRRLVCTHKWLQGSRLARVNQKVYSESRPVIYLLCDTGPATQPLSASVFPCIKWGYYLSYRVVGIHRDVVCQSESLAH